MWLHTSLVISDDQSPLDNTLLQLRMCPMAILSSDKDYPWQTSAISCQLEH